MSKEDEEIPYATYFRFQPKPKHNVREAPFYVGQVALIRALQPGSSCPTLGPRGVKRG